MIIPAADAARLLPVTGPAAIPGLAVPATLDAALGELETLQLTLARLSGTGGADDDLTGAAPGAAGPGVTLIAATGQGPARRLAGILDAGRRTGIAAVLLGAWPAGVTCQVAADGTVTAVTPPNPDLDGVRLFTLGRRRGGGHHRRPAGGRRQPAGQPPRPRPPPPPATGSAPRPQTAPRASAPSPPGPRRALTA